MLRSRLVIALMISAVVVGGCTRSTVPADKGNNESPTPGNPGGTSNTGLTAEQQKDWDKIEQLEAQAKALIKTDGCTASAECRTAPVGSRGCGGPRYYLTYCSNSTDSVALFAKLGEVAKAEQAYNQKNQVMSTCEFRMPPVVELRGGSCVAPNYTPQTR
jgi:hypothetical protein